MQSPPKLPPVAARPDTLASRLKKRRRLLVVSASLIAIAVADYIVMCGAGDIEPPLARGWRLAVTILLALFLARGTNSARWLTVILATLATFVGIVAVTLLALTDMFGSEYRYLLVWLALMTTAYATIAAFLAFSHGVTREIRRLESEIKG
jgi:hypothetical protein